MFSVLSVAAIHVEPYFIDALLFFISSLLQQREDSLLAGPLVGSNWIQSITILKRAAHGSGSSGGGVFTSTATQQRTLGSSDTLSPDSYQVPVLRPGELSLNDRIEFNAKLFNCKEEQEHWKDTIIEESPTDAAPRWRTDTLQEQEQEQEPELKTVTIAMIESKFRTTYVSNSVNNQLLNGFTCRALLPLEMKRFQLVFKPLQLTLMRKYQTILQLAWLKIWSNVERQRIKMFRKGESRLNHRKARKHYWFVSVGKMFTKWRDNARTQKEIRLRLDVLLSRKRIKLLHLSFSKQWINYMAITKQEYSDRISRAYKYWLHAVEAKAFRGWKSAVAKGIALRTVFKISKKWHHLYALKKTVRHWHIETYSMHSYANRCYDRMLNQFNQWRAYVEQQQRERRFLQRAGRKWRMSSKNKYFMRWHTYVTTQLHLRNLSQHICRAFTQLTLQFSFLQWQTVSREMVAAHSAAPQSVAHDNGLCDCLKRYGTKRNPVPGVGGHQENRSARRRRRRRVVGKPLRPFRCSMQCHLERRFQDVHDMVVGVQKENGGTHAMEKQAMKKQSRRASAVLRRSHWM